MNVAGRITIAPTFQLLSCNSSMLAKEPSDRKSFINITNYGNIYLDKKCVFAKNFPSQQLLVLNRIIIAICYEKILAFAVAKIGISTSKL